MGCGMSKSSAVPAAFDAHADAIRRGVYIKVSCLCPAKAPAEDGTVIPVSIPQTEMRGITIVQMEAIAVYINEHCEPSGWTATNPAKKGVALAPIQVNLYDLVHHLVKPVTAKASCSYVELVAFGEQRPQWFVSHFWGEPVLAFCACLRQHHQDRLLEKQMPYWVCAYANNQWHVGADVSHDPKDSSFRRAIDLAEGTVTILDGDAATFERIWCVYEIFLTLTQCGPNYKYDIYTQAEQGVIGLTDGLLKMDRGSIVQKLAREGEFPEPLLQHGFNKVNVQLGKASQDSDRIHILNSMVGAELDGTPPSHHEVYSKVNHLVRGRFAVAMSFWHGNPPTEMWPEVARTIQESGLRSIQLFFQEQAMTIDPVLGALPDVQCAGELEDLRLTVRNGIVRSVAELEALFDRLSLYKGLKRLELSLGKLPAIGGAQGVATVIAWLPRLAELGLQRFELRECGITEQSDAQGLLDAIEHCGKVFFYVDLSTNTGFGKTGKDGIKRIMRILKACPSLTDLSFFDCEFSEMDVFILKRTFEQEGREDLSKKVFF